MGRGGLAPGLSDLLAPVRVGVVSPFEPTLQAQAGGDFEDARREAMDSLVRQLPHWADPVFPGLISSASVGRDVARRFLEEGVEVLVVAPTTASPPSIAWETLRSLPSLPVVVLAVLDHPRITIDPDRSWVVGNSGPVGAAMVTNVLVRNGRNFLTVTGSLGQDDFHGRLEQALAACRAAARLRNCRIGMFGELMPGYFDLAATDGQLDLVGVEAVPVSSNALEGVFTAVDQTRIRESLKELASKMPIMSVDPDDIQRAVRLELALRHICETHDLDAGAVNCHGPVFRESPTIGIAACLAVSRLTDDGVPFSCTGDLPTAIALRLGRLIASYALYGELYGFDLEEDWALFANGGEGDLAAAVDGTCHVLPQGHYPGHNGTGAAVAFDVPSGPATLMSLTPLDRQPSSWRLVMAGGHVVGAGHTGLRAPNARFRFEQAPVAQAYEGWCAAGATHHAVLLDGDRRALLRATANLLSIEIREI